jgi:hypothetical protein
VQPRAADADLDDNDNLDNFGTTMRRDSDRQQQIVLQRRPDMTDKGD